MKSINIKYYNFNKKNLNNSLIKNRKKISEIKNTILNLPELNIISDKKLLDKTILQAKKFAVNKKNFLIFGTGGSNLGSKALVGILQNKEKAILSRRLVELKSDVPVKQKLESFLLKE